MKFFELVACTPWDEVESSFLTYYGSGYKDYKKRIKKKKLKKFKETYAQLTATSPKETSWRIIVNKYTEDNEVYGDVSGLNSDPADDHYYGLGATPPDEWLGMTIDSRSFESFSHCEIAAHCLWELTFYGFPNAN